MGQCNILIGYDTGWKYHFFKCVAKKCKGKGHKDIHCYQDSKDCTATSNLKSHTIKCFGEDAVHTVFENTQSGAHDGSIFVAFAYQGQHPVKDCQFENFMKAGWPGTTLPSLITVLHDIQAAFEKCCECIDNILKVCCLLYFF